MTAEVLDNQLYGRFRALRPAKADLGGRRFDQWTLDK